MGTKHEIVTKNSVHSAVLVLIHLYDTHLPQRNEAADVRYIAATCWFMLYYEINANFWKYTFDLSSDVELLPHCSRYLYKLIVISTNNNIIGFCRAIQSIESYRSCNQTMRSCQRFSYLFNCKWDYRYIVDRALSKSNSKTRSENKYIW